ncbi:MAG: TetR/AcrR family transcriptional regulator [Candidatus Binatia bacterium]|nr:TetR/AcrR family transcriptional regulator [Candidatus Binatia bacterium]
MERVKGQVLRKRRKPTSQVMDEQRLLEGRERIAAAAASLFLDGGYHSTSVREIAYKAGLSVGSVFNYFRSKEEILFFLFARNQARFEASLQDQRVKFAQLKEQGVDPRELLMLAYRSYVQVIDESRRYTVLAYQELKSLTVAERRRLLEGEERIQRFMEEVIAYGVEKGVFPAGDIDLKAHCLLVLAQAWAVRRWALKRFAKVDDYFATLQPIALGIVCSETPSLHSVEMVAAAGSHKTAPDERNATVE